MPKRLRGAVGGVVYHVLNRSNGRVTLFREHGDYFAFEKVLAQAHERVLMRTLAYCIMPNHWHLVLWPREDGDLSEFMRWLTVTHTKRWQVQHETVGYGHLYQGRFKSLPIEADGHFLAVCRYVERNALRAGLVRRAEEWRWCSLWRRQDPARRQAGLMAEWPVPRPQDWLGLVNEPQNAAELAGLRECVQRSRPFGSADWVDRTAAQFGLESTLRSPGRPTK